MASYQARQVTREKGWGEEGDEGSFGRVITETREIQREMRVRQKDEKQGDEKGARPIQRGANEDAGETRWSR